MADAAEADNDGESGRRVLAGCWEWKKNDLLASVPADGRRLPVEMSARKWG